MAESLRVPIHKIVGEDISDKDVSENAKGQDWEVVSLTASTYAAAPGPRVPDDEKSGAHADGKTQLLAQESFESMIRSQHFTFPHGFHEDIPSSAAKHLEDSSSVKVSDSGSQVEDLYGKLEKSASTKSAQSLFESQGTELGEIAEQIDKMEMSYKHEDKRATKHFDWIDPSHHSIATPEVAILAGLQKEAQEVVMTLPKEPSVDDADDDKIYDEVSKGNNKAKETSPENGLPCSAWWKRNAASLYSNAKQANALWPIAVAAALMGLVFLGQKWQNQQLNSEVSGKDEEKVSLLLYQAVRLKEAIIGRRKVPIIRSSS